jgi:hypothetical protein
VGGIMRERSLAFNMGGTGRQNLFGATLHAAIARAASRGAHPVGIHVSTIARDAP